MWPPARMALNLVAHKPAGAVTFPNAIFPSDLARSRGVSRAAFWDTLALTLRGFMEGVVDVRAVCKPAMRRLGRMVVAIDEMRLSTGPVLGRCTDARHCEDFLQ